MLEKVTDPNKIVTDGLVLKQLAYLGIDPDYVELWKDYGLKSEGLNPYAKHYRDLKSNKRFMVVSGLPKVNADGVKIDAGWEKKGDKYYSKANLFSAVVQSNQITVEAPNGNKATWKPQLSLNNIEQKGGKAILLETDSTNENYHYNVLEWDYGICKRRIRLIEGSIRDKWIFNADPKGEVKIKHNIFGNLPMKLGLGIEKVGEPLDIKVEGDTEIISAEAFANAVYPVEIGGSPETFYSAAADGYVYNNGSTGVSYATVHDAAIGNEINDTNENFSPRNQYYSPNNSYNVRRGFIPFDTSGLPDACTITGVTMSIYSPPDTTNKESDAGHSDVCLYEGNQHDTLELADYDAFQTTLLTAGTYSWAHPLSTTEYTSATLIDIDSDGFGYISKTGTTKFCLRLKGDADKATPTGDNYTRILTNEKGDGYYPKLVVTYEEAPPAPTLPKGGSMAAKMLAGGAL